MQVKESYYCSEDKVSRQRMLYSLGRYDESIYRQVKDNISDWQPLNKGKVVIKEIDDNSGPLQGKAYFMKYSRSKR